MARQLIGDEESSFEGTRAQNTIISDSRGNVDLKGLLSAWDDLFTRVNATTDKITKASEAAVKATENVKRVFDDIENTSTLKAVKQATKTSYSKAIELAESQGEHSKANALRKKQQEEELKQNKEFNERLKASFKEDVINGIFTRDLKGAIQGFKQNIKEASNYYGSFGKVLTLGIVKGLASGISTATKALNGFAKGLNSTISSIAGYKTAWDTRLYGSGKGHSGISDLVRNNLALSPFVKQQTVMEKLNSAIGEGIAYNVEQRAFLAAISDSIATTFDAFDTTLKDLVRVQQADSTAYRLGMEASLNKYLNAMFETTEYLNAVSDTVTTNLYQATSLLDSSKAIDYEYQIQKWLGALYSVGMSSSAVGNISNALGQLLSGDISGTESGAGKLLVMAAANSGVDYAKLLTDGINSSDINLLMESMVSYLQEIASDNKVVQSQMAGIFGIQTADIRAAKNLTGVVNDIFKSGQGYNSNSAMGMLSSMLGSVGSRMSMGAMLENLTDNFKYTLAEGIASNPALYGILSIGNLLEETVGGINIPTISVMGNMVDLEATVADLLRAGALGGSIMAGIGPLFSGLGELFTGNGLIGAYNRFASTSASSVSIGGKGLGIGSQTLDSSLTAYQGNSNSDDYMNANQAMIEDTKKEASVSAEENYDHKTTDDMFNVTQEILSLLQDVTDAARSLNVKVTNFEDFPFPPEKH